MTPACADQIDPETTGSRHSLTWGGLIKASGRDASCKSERVCDIAHVVLDPPVVPVRSERVGEVHVRSDLGEDISRQYEPQVVSMTTSGSWLPTPCSPVDGVDVDTDRLGSIGPDRLPVR